LKREPFTSDDGLRGEKMAGQKPVAKFRAGQVSAALWENEITVKNGGKATMLKATVQRRYRDKDGTWKSSGSFSRNEIPLAIYCLQKAFEKIIEVQIDSANGDGVVEEAVA
jgi:hypothetical protein